MTELSTIGLFVCYRFWNIFAPCDILITNHLLGGINSIVTLDGFGIFQLTKTQMSIEKRLQ